MKNIHPIRFVLPAVVVVLAALLFWLATGASLQSIAFWKGATVLLFLKIVVLSVDLFRHVSRLYPLLRIRSNHAPSHQTTKLPLV